MSEPPKGLLSAVAAPIAEELHQHGMLPPDKKNANRASFGAFILGICGYCFVTLDPADYPSGWKLGFAAVCIWGLLLLVIGWRGSRGRREVISGIWHLSIPVGGFIAVIVYAPELLANPYAQAFCWGTGFAHAVRFIIDVRGPGSGTAEKQVRQQIAQRQFNWKPATRR